MFFLLFFQAKSEDELAREKAFIEANRVWLQHRDGFTPATLLPGGEGNSEGKVRLQLDGPEKEMILADEEEVVKANPARFDQAEDLAHLRHLNEASMLHTLRCRYAARFIHEPFVFSSEKKEMIEGQYLFKNYVSFPISACRILMPDRVWWSSILSRRWPSTLNESVLFCNHFPFSLFWLESH